MQFEINSTYNWSTIAGNIISQSFTGYATWGLEEMTGHEWHTSFNYPYLVQTCENCGLQETLAFVGVKAATVSTMNYSYTDDDYGVTVYTLTLFYYDEDGEEQTFDVEVTDEEEINNFNREHDWILEEDSVVPTTCSTDGFEEYVCEDCGITKSITYEAYGHNFEPVFVWNDDYTECIVNITCSECGEIQGSLEAEIEVTENEDSTVYTASIVYNNLTYTDSVIVQNETTSEPLQPDDNGNSGDSNPDSEPDPEPSPVESEPEGETEPVEETENTSKNTSSEVSGTVSNVVATTSDSDNNTTGSNSGITVTEVPVNSTSSNNTKTATNTSTNTSGSNNGSSNNTTSTEGAKTSNNLLIEIPVLGAVALIGVCLIVIVKRKENA